MGSKAKSNISKSVLVLLLMIWTLFPIYWMFSLAFRSNDELRGTIAFLPKSFTMSNFVDLFAKKNFGISVCNSIEVTCISLVISLVFGLCCAYILARARFKFKMKGPMLFWVLLIRVLPPIAFALPLYIMFSNAGMLSTKVPLILAHCLINIPFIVWFMIIFFENVPVAVEESASVDGATEMQMFNRIVLPQVLPGLAAVAILSFMTSWNEYLYAVIFVQMPSNFTIPLSLATLNSEQELTQWGVVASGGIISLIPIAIFVIFAQNFLISGLSGGAVKE